MPLQKIVLKIDQVESQLISYKGGSKDLHMGRIRKDIQGIVRDWKSLSKENQNNLSLSLRYVISLADAAKKERNRPSNLFSRIYKAFKKSFKLQGSWDKTKAEINVSSYPFDDKIVASQALKDFTEQRAIAQRLKRQFSSKVEEPESLVRHLSSHFHSLNTSMLQDFSGFETRALNNYLNSPPSSGNQQKLKILSEIAPRIKRAQEDLKMISEIQGSSSELEEIKKELKKLVDSVLKADGDSQSAKQRIIEIQKDLRNWTQSIRDFPISLPIFTIPKESELSELNFFLEQLDKILLLDSNEEKIDDETRKEINRLCGKYKGEFTNVVQLVFMHIGNSARGESALTGKDLENRRREVRYEVLAFFFSLHGEPSALVEVEKLERKVTEDFSKGKALDKKTIQSEINSIITDWKEFAEEVQVVLAPKIMGLLTLLKEMDPDLSALIKDKEEVEKALEKFQMLYSDIQKRFVSSGEIDDFEPFLYTLYFDSKPEDGKVKEEIALAKLEAVQYIRRVKMALVYQKMEGASANQLEALIQIFRFKVNEKVEEVERLQLRRN